MRKNDTRFNRPKGRKVSGKKLRSMPAPRAMKMKVKKGDTVKILTGKDKGKTGEVTEVMPKTGLIVVDGVNIAKRALRSPVRGQSGRIVERPMPINASNVAVTGKAAKKEKAPKAERADKAETKDA